MNASDHDRPQAEPLSDVLPRSDVLVVRVWVEPSADEPVRARLLTTTSGSEETTTFAVAAGIDVVCALVRGWLRDIER